MLGQEMHQPSCGGQAGKIAVQIQPVDALDFQGDVTFEQFVNVSHDRKLYTTSTHGANARRFEVEDFARKLREAVDSGDRELEHVLLMKKRREGREDL